MTADPVVPPSLIEAAVWILSEGDPFTKAQYTNSTVAAWRAGSLPVHPAAGVKVVAPERPARSDDKVKIVAPGLAPKRGNGGSLASRQALLHSLCHIENWAVDLSWDVIARFGGQADYELPRDFFDDFVTVAEDECRHFLRLEARLKETGSFYGALPAHDGLWDSASKTTHSLAARLAIESCVHEARGLDILPTTISKFRNNKDELTAQLLEQVIYPEEVNHCAAGVRWFRHLYNLAHQKYASTAPAVPKESDASVLAAAQSSSSLTGASAEHVPDWAQEALKYSAVQEWFHDVVRKHFWGSLKPPFNEAAREKAGFEKSWYLPLVTAAPAAAKK